MESRFEFRTFGFDTTLNHYLSQKLKLIGRSKFNHLINTLKVITKTKLSETIFFSGILLLFC
jgi:hypothetical protein